MGSVKVLDEIGSGIQGKVFRAELSEPDGTTSDCAVKIIECPDVNYANKLFGQLMKLQDLDHKGVLVPKDVFISWEEASSSVGVNIVYPLFSKPSNLQELISDCLDNVTNMTTSQMHAVVGEIIDAMQNVLEHGFLHLNLKPSNVFCSSGGFMIGDFGLPALLSDIETRTRTTDGLLYKFTELEYLYRIVKEPASLHTHHPPELKDGSLERKFDGKTDVFALGLLIYQIYFLELQVPRDVSEWRKNADNIEDSVLRGLFMQMTDPNHETRPSIGELVNLPEVQHLMEVAERERIALKRQKSAKVPHKLVPVDSSIDVIIDNLSSALNSEELTRASFRAIYALTSKTSSLDNEQKTVIVNAAKYHEEVQDIQEKFLAIAYNLVPLAEDESDPFCDVTACQHLMAVMKRYVSTENIVYACLQVSLLISAHRFGANNIAKSKMLPVLSLLMEKYPGDRLVAIRLALWIFWGVLAYSENKREMAKARLPQVICGLAQVASKEESLLEPFTACLWSLSIYPESSEEFKRVSGVDLLLQIIQDFQQEPRILRNCCMALATVVEADEVCAYTVLASRIDDPFTVLRNVYVPNRDNPEFVHAYVTLLAELSSYDEIRYELHRLNFLEISKEVELFYQASEKILKAAQSTTANLEAYKLEMK